jgi:uncharacterized protein YjbJ (UPF0337 family)
MASLFNDNVLKGKWNEIKGELRRNWGDLTDDELDQTQGDLTSLGGLIQKKYGIAQEDVRGKVNELIANFRRDLGDQEVHSARQDREDVSSNVRDQYRPN